MANLRITSSFLQMAKTFLFDEGVAGLTADQIAMAQIPATGTASGEDLYTVINRKLEAAGILAEGVNDPVFATDTALLYHQTTRDVLFLRGSTAYTELPVGTDANIFTVFLDSATEPDITTAATWDGTNFVEPITGTTSWTQTKPNNPTNTVWMQIYYVEEASYIVFTPVMPIDNIHASLIAYTPPSTDGNIPQSVDNVKEGLDAFHTADLTQGGGGGTGEQNVNADWDATSGDAEILNKPVVPQTGHYNPTGIDDDLNMDSSPPHTVVEHDITIDSGLRTYSNEYDSELAIKTAVSVYFEGISTSVGQPIPRVTIRYEVLNMATNTVLLTEEGDISIPDTNRAERTYYITGLLPVNIERIKLKVTYVSRHNTQGVEGLGWVGTFDWTISRDLTAASIPIDPDAYGGNLRANEGLHNVAEALDQLDELPVAFADDEDLAWTAALDLSQDPPNNRQQTIPIDQLIVDSNARDRRNYVVRMNFHARHAGADGPTISYVLDIHSDLNNYATLLSSPTGTVNATGENNPSEFAIPAGTQMLRFTFKPPVDSGNNPISQGAARLTVTNFQISEMEGVDTTGFVETGRITDRNDRTLQSVSEKVNAATGSQIPIDNSQFSNPDRSFGGLREATTGTIPALPSNTQQGFEKVDWLIQRNINFYHQTWKLHRHVGGTVYSSTFDLGATTTSEVSEQVTISPELRRYAIDADGDIELILHLSTTAISQDANMTVGLWSATTGGTQYGDNFLLTGPSATAGSRTAANTAAIFRMTLPANSADSATTANVPENFYIRFNRTAGSVTLTDGFIDFGRIGQEGASGGVGGSVGSEWEVIWEAGPNFSDRLTTTSGSVLRNLKTGKRFDQFTDFMLQIDTNATAGVGLFVPAPEPAIKMMIDGTWTGNEGTWIQIKYGFYKLLRPNSQTSFYILGGSEIGYRKLWAR